MKKFLYGAYMSIIASTAIAIIALTMFYAPLRFHIARQALNVALERDRAIQYSLLQKNLMAQAETEIEYDCIPQNIEGVGVGGLKGVDVPRISKALRLEYENARSSQYTTTLDENKILNYYLSELLNTCWKLSAINPHEMVWQKDESALRIAVAQSPIGGKSRIYYETGSGVVLGVSYAQTTEGSAPPPPPPPPPSGDSGSGFNQPPPPPPSGTSGNFGQPYGGMNPPPDGSFGQQQGGQGMYGQPGQEKSGGYWCNGKQVSQGEPCNGYAPQGPNNGFGQGDMNGNKMMGPNNMGSKNNPNGGQQNFGNTQKGQQGFGQMGPQGKQGMMNRGGNQRSAEQGFGGQDREFQNRGQGSEEGFSESSDDQEQKIDEERLKQMKQGLSQFTKGISQFQKMVSKMKPRLAKLGVGIPAELEAALAKAPEILAQIKSAQSADEVETLMEDIQDIGDSMKEWGEKFGDLMKLGEMLKQADKEIKNLQKAIKRLQTAAKKNPAAQETINNLNTMASEMAQILQNTKELAKTEPDSALEKLENEFFGKMEEFWNSVAEADTIVNITKGIGQAKKEIAKAKTKIKSLEKNKKINPDDIQAIKNLVTTAEEKLNELELLAREKASAEEVQAVSGELWDLLKEYENKLSEIGQGSYKPNVQSGENVNFELPQAFDFGPRNSQGAGGDGGQGFDSGF